MKNKEKGEKERKAGKRDEERRLILKRQSRCS